MPTDKRYRELSDEQIDVLFQYHLICPGEEQLREYYRQEVQTQVVQSTLPVDLLRSQGWSDEQIERMKKDIPLAAGRGK